MGGRSSTAQAGTGRPEVAEPGSGGRPLRLEGASHLASCDVLTYTQAACPARSLGTGCLILCMKNLERKMHPVILNLVAANAWCPLGFGLEDLDLGKARFERVTNSLNLGGLLDFYESRWSPLWNGFKNIHISEV